MRISFLGTGSLESLPRKGCRCPQCRSKDKKDRRLRSSILIENKVLIDAGPDIIEQIQNSKCKIQNLKAVIITHKHEDHIGGLNKLKIKNEKLKIYFPKDGERLRIGEIEFFAFEVPHSKILKTHGLLINKINKKVAYIPDFSEITPKMKKILKKSQIAILDGSMLNHPFGGHMPIKNQISKIKDQKLISFKTKIFFTHNGHTHLPHRKLSKYIQKQGGKNFQIAYDGEQIVL